MSDDESFHPVKGLTFSRKKEKAFSDQFFLPPPVSVIDWILFKLG